MSSEEELQDELKKLEIGIGLATKSSSKKNPFFQDVDNHNKTLLNLNNNKRSDENTLKFFGDPQVKCGCRIRQTSESTLDLDSDISRLSATSSSSIRTISRRSFKPKKKPVLLREPIMKSIQNCFHHKSLRKSCPGNLEPSTSSHDPQFFEALNLASITITRNGPSQSHPLDFRDLCKELEFNKPTDYLAHGRKSKNFNSIQTTENRTKTIPKLRNCPSCSQQARINGSGGVVGQNHTVDNNNSPSNSVSMAGGGAVNTGTGDDVTIDELASYFETFVHIPKKMSSMAEMMYI